MNDASNIQSGLEEIAEAVIAALTSQDEENIRGKPVNIVDAIHYMAEGFFSIANAISPRNTLPGVGADGSGRIDSLTEAVMDASYSLNRIANSIDNLTEAVESKGP